MKSTGNKRFLDLDVVFDSLKEILDAISSSFNSKEITQRFQQMSAGNVRMRI
jgi:hypothetical protein